LQRTNKMALSTISQELFTGLGTVAGTVGTFHKKRIGPRASVGDLGWSADVRKQAQCYTAVAIDIASPAIDFGLVSQWMYVQGYTVSSTNEVWVIRLLDNNGNRFCNIRMQNDYNLRYDQQGQTLLSLGLIPTHQWVELRAAWRKDTSTTFTFEVMMRTIGGSWTTLHTVGPITLGTGGAVRPATWDRGFRLTGGTPAINGRIGSPSLCSMGAWEDRYDDLPSVIAPPVPPYNWYLDPTNGSDANDGSSPAQAWKTNGFVTTESANAGLFSREPGWVNTGTLAPITAASFTADQLATMIDDGEIECIGDRLIISSNNSDEQRVSSLLEIKTDNLRVTSDIPGTRAVLSTYKVVSGWSKTGGYTNIYQATDSVANCVLWEDRKWMAHPKGANLAAVGASLDATPGSFWTDGTTMYAHPFGSTNPTSDGKVYERSVVNSANAGILQQSRGGEIRDIGAVGTALVNPAGTDLIGGYGVSLWAEQTGGLGVCRNLFADNCGKHVFSNAAVTRSDTRVIWLDCEAGRMPPLSYVAVGAATSWVDYYLGGSGNQAAYRRCSVNANGNTGVVGSASGRSREVYYSSIYGHGGASASSGLWIRDCDLRGGGRMNYFSSANPIITDCDWSAGNENATFTGCTLRDVMAGIGGTYNECVFIADEIEVVDNNPRITANTVIDHCTFDLRLVSGIVAFWDVDSFLVTIRDSVILLGDSMFISGLTSALLLANNNVYQADSTSKLIYRNFDAVDRTLAGMQTAGEETASTITLNANLSSSYYPLKNSVAVGFASDTTDSGAYQYEVVPYAFSFSDYFGNGSVTSAEWEAVKAVLGIEDDSATPVSPSVGVLSDIKEVTDKLDTMIQLDGLVWQFTTNAVENVVAGGGGGVSSITIEDRSITVG